MKYKTIIYVILLIIGVVIGAGGYSILWNGGSSTAESQDEEKTLYSCGMHPNIIEEEPGTCPICGMNLTPIRSTKSTSSKKESSERKILYWRAPMNPNEVYDAPGKSQMGMDLVPVYEDEGGASGVVTVDGSVLQSMNVKMDFVKARKLTPTIYTNGTLKTDETREFNVTTKIGGWVEKLYVNYTGQKVRKGQKLADIYSPEFFAAQQELITALSYDGSVSSSTKNQMLNNAISKLELYDVSKNDINKIIETKKVNKYMTLYAPFNGTVITKNIVEGDKISAGKEIMTISDLSNLWLKADVYESDLNKVQLGAKAKIQFSYKPEKEYEGKVSFIYPTVNPVTRTIEVRIDIKNANDELKPFMFGNVEIRGNDLPELPTIPETAVIRSGKESIVILSLGDGKFKPIDVKLGQYSDGYYQVLSGLNVNDVIVTSGQFMIDSESSLRSAVNLFSSAKTKPDSEKSEMTEEEMKNMNKSDSNDEMKSSSEKTEEHAHATSIVHEGVINLSAIDKNGDGKVFQDMMDWNVISDEAGRCPLCGMYLKEVTIDEAKKNLKENGFEYK